MPSEAAIDKVKTSEGWEEEGACIKATRDVLRLLFDLTTMASAHTQTTARRRREARRRPAKKSPKGLEHGRRGPCSTERAYALEFWALKNSAKKGV